MLTPLVGYERAAEIVKRAVRENRSIIEVAAEELGLDASKLRDVLDPMRWTEPGILEK